MAMSFPDISAAITTEQRLGLLNAELVLMMLDYPSQYDAIFPMGQVVAGAIGGWNKGLPPILRIGDFPL